MIDNQGFIGALYQYWNISDKPRLYRRNTWFEDHLQFSQVKANHFYIVITVLALAIFILMNLGVIL